MVLMHRLILLLLISVWSVAAQVPFATSPVWISSDVANYSTGAGWADMNNDGWLDLVVANGNDMGRQRVAVYLNTGSGTLPLSPTWQSADIDFNGHLSIGDVNNDGFPDVAVSVYIGAAGFSQKGRVKLYMNNNGVLSSQPSWVSADSMYTFSCAFGDANGDGLLDLAVACGESYTNRAERNRIYYNRGGRLDSLPGWQSAALGFSLDVGWGDFDLDGKLDLLFAGERGPNRMFRNHGDSIGTVPIWTSSDPSQYANSLFIADVNNDGWIDLAISDNNQLGGSGRFKIYLNQGGMLDSMPFWSSAFSGYGSGISLADIDNDGWRDLITGGWWQSLRIYMNQSGSFTTAPQWTSGTNSVVEAIVFGDYDADGLDTLTFDFTSSCQRPLFVLPRAPVHRILHVIVDNDTLPRSGYSADLENGWIHLASRPLNGTLVAVVAIVSSDLDFAVSNWDNNIGNYLFRNLTPPVAVGPVDMLPGEMALMQNYPNPFNPKTNFQFSIGNFQFVTLKIFDVLGREVTTLVEEFLKPGRYEMGFDGSKLASGVYFYRLRAGSFVATKKLLLLR